MAVTLSDIDVAIIASERPTLEEIASPMWRGNLEEFWEANQDQLNWGNIQMIRAEIIEGHQISMERNGKWFLLVSDVLRLGYLLGTPYDMISGFPWHEHTFLRELALQSPKYMARVHARMEGIRKAQTA
jgi:hypothetical protein